MIFTMGYRSPEALLIFAGLSGKIIKNLLILHDSYNLGELVYKFSQ